MEQKQLKVRVGARKGDRRPGKGCSMYRIHLCGNQNSKELESLLSFIILNYACMHVNVNGCAYLEASNYPRAGLKGGCELSSVDSGN